MRLVVLLDHLASFLGSVSLERVELILSCGGDIMGVKARLALEVERAQRQVVALDLAINEGVIVIDFLNGVVGAGVLALVEFVDKLHHGDWALRFLVFLAADADSALELCLG